VSAHSVATSAIESRTADSSLARAAVSSAAQRAAPSRSAPIAVSRTTASRGAATVLTRPSSHAFRAPGEDLQGAHNAARAGPADASPDPLPTASAVGCPPNGGYALTWNHLSGTGATDPAREAKR